MPNQFSLLKTRRFLPIFLIQFLAAFTDNVYKNALVIFIAFQASQLSSAASNTLINLAAAAFILPFILFSAFFGQVADKLEKSRIVTYVKVFEIFITLCAFAAFELHNLFLCLFVLFCYGLHSTIFGPIKYSLLPQHLHPEELVGGNGLMESSTFIAILLGTLVGGVLIVLHPYGVVYLCASILLCSLIGLISSFWVPLAPSYAKHLKINYHFLRQTWQNLRYLKTHRPVGLAILGISWFWFVGSVFFYQIPNYVKLYLGGGPEVVTLLFATLIVGIALGSLLCERLSHHHIELGLVPLGTLGVSLFAITLSCLHIHLAHAHHLTVMDFLALPHHVAILLSLFLMGACSGLYTVPLYAYMQEQADPEYRSRVVAGSNILGSLFMIIAAGFSILLLATGMSISMLFLTVGIINVFAFFYIYALIPAFFYRLLVWMLMHVLYRFTVTGKSHFPRTGSALLICNHVSFVDVPLISTACTRPIRFVMDLKLFNTPVLNYISKLGKTIPIASSKENHEVKEEAMRQIAEALQAGDLVAIFPEGNITRDGHLQTFKKGIEDILKTTPVPVIPMALQGLWGSFFSRKHGPAMSRWPRRFWSKIHLVVGKPLTPEGLTAEILEQRVKALLASDAYN